MPGRYLVCFDKNGVNLPAEPGFSRRWNHAAGSACMWADTQGIDIGSRGHIVGHLFEKGSPGRRVTHLRQRESDDIIASPGRVLLERYWGAYIAVLTNPDDRGITVLRDPSGGLPCLIMRSGERTVVVSDVALGAGAFEQPIEIDYVELARFISGTDQMGRRTCLQSVDELLPGEQFCYCDGSATVQTLWSPWSFADIPRELSIDLPDVLASLRSALMDCTASWASCFEHIVLGVSGGLDSSTVAVGASDVCRDLRCFTMIGPDPDGDESAHARVLTDFLGLRLLRMYYDIDRIDIEHAILPHLPWPVGSLFLQGIEQAHQELAQQAPVDAWFAGNGGDGVLCSLRSASPLVDRYLAEGLSRGCISTLKDIADLTGADVFTILRMARRRLRSSRKGFIPHRDICGLTPAIVERMGPRMSHHPWLGNATSPFPGKWAHVAMITRSHRSIEFHPRTRAPQIAPLMSQPIVERALAIPTWQWVAGGRDRSMARRALENVLLPALLQRTGKGGPDGFMHMIYRARWSQMRSFLRDGALIANGLLDPAFLDQPFDPGGHGRSHAMRMLAFVSAESWVRAWTGQ